MCLAAVRRWESLVEPSACVWQLCAGGSHSVNFGKAPAETGPDPYSVVPAPLFVDATRI